MAHKKFATNGNTGHNTHILMSLISICIDALLKPGQLLLKAHIIRSQNLSASPEAPFNWKLLLIGIVSAKGIWKKVPILQVGGPAHARPTPPVIRVVLLHTEAVDKD